MNTYLYRIWPGRRELLTEGPTSGEERAISAHYEYLCGLASRNVVLLAGRTNSNATGDFGIVIFQAADETEAREIMEGDPAVGEGVFVADIFPFDIALVCDDVSLLGRDRT